MSTQQIPSPGTLEQYVFLPLLLVVTVLFLFLLKPLFSAIFWACAVSLLFYPVQLRLLRRFGDHPNLSALATLILCIVVAVIPMLLILTSIVQEGATLYARIDSGELNPEDYVDRLQVALPFLQKLLDWAGIDLESFKQQISTGALAASSFAAKNVLSLGQSTFRFILSLGLMLYLTFFLLRDGAALVVAMVQGVLGGLIFWILDIHAAVLWAVAIALVSLIPAVGAGLVWLPFAIYLFAVGEINSSLVLVIYGILVIGLADNLLRPLLVGRDTKLPDWLVLLSTLGGLVMFGIDGLVLGPLITAMFLVFWQIFSRDYNRDELKGQQ
jgi:predicted PurR-regulated permease PerM